jgi:NADPH:quinone reductase-like Zn-dependent oxidoreductase
MKKFILFFALSLAATTTFAKTNHNDLINRIQNQLGFSAAEKAKLGSGVAVVAFTIDANGMRQILQCYATAGRMVSALGHKRWIKC